MKNIFAILLIAGAIVIFVFYTNPQYQNIKHLQTQQSDYTNALAEANTLLGQQKNLDDAYQQISSDSLDRLNKLLPGSIDNIRLIIDINSIANKRGMSIRGIQINKSGGSSNTLGPSSSKYGTLSMSFSVTASYDTFISFLNDLQQSLRLIDITAISFSPTDKGDIYDYNVTINTYWLK